MASGERQESHEEEPFTVLASRFKREVEKFSDAEEIARCLAVQGKKVEILQDYVVIAKARPKEGYLVWDIHPSGPRKEKLEGAFDMAKWRLIGGGARRTFVSLEDKVKAIADIYVKSKPVKDVLAPLYERADKELPKNTSIVMANWRKSVQLKLDAEDKFTIDLCKTYQVIEEGEAPPPRKRGKK